ncbi:MAG: DUF3299 domain-containing protein [Pseudomonadota bacterium]
MLLVSPYLCANTEYKTVDWVELMPAEDLEALMNPPDFLDAIEEGSEQDSIESIKQLTEEDENAKRFFEALKSAEVIPEFDDKNIRIPGFIVPLVSDEEQRVTEFFVVPYFGACLHLPPPPPNQIIYAKSIEGVELTTLSMPFWFEGNITIESHNNDLGASAYGMAAHNVVPYDTF